MINISTNATDFSTDWEIIHCGKAQKHSREEVVCRIMKSENSSMVKLTFSVGLEVAELCDFKVGDKVLFLRNKLHDLNFLIKKSPLKETYTLCRPNQANCLSFTVTYPTNNKFILSQNRSLHFDINQDKSLFIDLNKMMR